MPERLLRIRIRTVGQETVQRAVRGITQGARQAAREQAQAERQSVREAQQSARARERIAAREAQTRARVAREAAATTAQAERTAMRESQREANAIYAMRMRQAREQQRQAERVRQLRDQQRAQRGRVEMGVAAGVTGAGIAQATAAMNAYFDAMTQRIETLTSAVGGRAGVQDIGQRTATAQDFELQLARSSGEFFQGMSPEERARQMSDLADEINRVAIASGQSPTELLNVLSTMQERFSAFGQGRRDLQAIADEAQRTGASMETLAEFVGIVGQQLGDTAPTAQRTFDILAEAGLQGSVTPESFAENYGGLLGQFQSQTGLQGEDALRQLLALANVVRPGAQSDSEAATQVHALMGSMGDQRTRDRLREATGGHRVGHGASAHWEGGTTAIHDDGTIDYPQLIRDMSTVHGIGSTNEVFRRSEARLAVDTLTRAQTAPTQNRPSVDQLISVDADAAARRRAEDIQRVHSTSAYTSRAIAVQGEVEGIQQLQPRVTTANEHLAFQEAVRQTGSEGLLGMLGSVPMLGEVVQQSIAPALAAMIADLSPETRAGVSNVGGAVSRSALGAGVGGIPIAAAAAAATELFGQLGTVGDRAKEIQRNVRLEPGTAVALAPGSRVELGEATIAQIGSAVASSMPETPTGSPLAPTTSAERRTPARTR